MKEIAMTQTEAQYFTFEEGAVLAGEDLKLPPVFFDYFEVEGA